MELKFKNKRSEFIITPYAPCVIKDFSTSVGVDIYETRGLYQDGTTIDNSALQSRTISIKFIIASNNEIEYESLKRSIIKTLDTNESLVLEYEDNTIRRKINCKPTKLPVFSKNGPCLANVLINLKCPDPYWQDVISIQKEIALWVNNFEFEVCFPIEGIEFGFREPSLLVEMFSESDVDCGMLIRFYALGTVSNPSLMNVETQEFIKLNHTMEAGEVVEIDTSYGNKRITSLKNGVQKSIWNSKDYKSTFLQMKIGDNLYRYDATSNLENLNVTIYYTPKYREI